MCVVCVQQILAPIHHFFLSCCLFFMSAACYTQVHSRLEIFMEANNINPGQAAPILGSSLIWDHIVCNIGYLEHEKMKGANDTS